MGFRSSLAVGKRKIRLLTAAPPSATNLLLSLTEMQMAGEWGKNFLEMCDILVTLLVPLGFFVTNTNWPKWTEVRPCCVQIKNREF